MIRSEFGYVTAKQPPIMNLVELANAPVISYDVETTGVHPVKDHPYGFSITSTTHDAYWSDACNPIFLDILNNPDPMKIAFNGKFDRSMMKQMGIEVKNTCDPMVAGHLLEIQGSLEDLSHYFIGNEMVDMVTFDTLEKKLIQMSAQELAQFSGPHSVNALILWNKLESLLRQNFLWNVFWKVEMPTLPVLSDMETNGCLIDTTKLASLGEYFDQQAEIFKSALDYRAEGTNSVGINWNSADQAADYFYNKINVPKPPPYTYRGKKRPSVDKKHLEKYKTKFDSIVLYLKFKEMKHFKSTYVDGVLKRLVNGRIHTNYNQTRTDTGRLSSTDPNLQNIPQRSAIGRRIREAFIARPGYVLLKSDYEQMELRRMADAARCWAMINAFLAGRDIHMETAMRLWNDDKRRADGKTKNFQLIYGGGPEEDKKMMFEAYPEIRSWTEKAYNQMEATGVARTIFGRMRTLGSPQEMYVFRRDNLRHFEELCRGGVSVMIQGSCSEICKIGMANVWKYIKDTDVKLELQVHDEIVVECPEDLQQDVADLLYEKMRYDETSVPMPVEVKVGKNWADMKSIKHS